MKLSLLLGTKNKSLSVKTLHSILKLNILLLQRGIHTNISFVNENPFTISETITRDIKKYDRIIFISYSIYVDETSLEKLIGDIPKGYNGIILPAVTEGIDWDMFRNKVKSGVDTEPYSQMGLNFDTEVGTKINEDFWAVKSTDPKAWVLDCNNSLKHLKEKKGHGVKIPPRVRDLFSKLKMCAFTKAELTVTYTHECLGNILEAAGVRQVT